MPHSNETPKPILKPSTPTKSQGVNHNNPSSIRFSSDAPRPELQHSQSAPSTRPYSTFGPTPAATSHMASGSETNLLANAQYHLNTARTSVIIPQIVIPPPEPAFRVNLPNMSNTGHHQGQVSAPAGGSVTRRSSRPTSPSSSTFGARISNRNSHMSVAGPHAPNPSSPLANHSVLAETGNMSTPPIMSCSHITTPPTVYVSTMQQRAPPPPSPYRPTTTTERRSSISSFSQGLPALLPLMNEDGLAARPPRHSSLFATLTPSESMRTLTDVPMVNIIPATPQDNGDEFAGAWTSSAGQGQDHTASKRRSVSIGLEEAPRIDENAMEEIPLESGPAVRASQDHSQEVSGRPTLPSIDIELDFSPFQPLYDLPEQQTISDQSSHVPMPIHSASPTPTPTTIQLPVFQDQDLAETEDQASPHSPPFESYPSLPSLASHASFPSSSSEDSMMPANFSSSSSTTSSASSSVMSFPDVEEALGSMLASLSDHDLMPQLDEQIKKDLVMEMREDGQVNPGLGLGLELMPTPIPALRQRYAITAPLSPNKSKKKKPAPLDLSLVKDVDQPVVQTAPLPMPYMRNHRVAFYRTAKAAPNSPTSGIFTNSSNSLASSASSLSTTASSESTHSVRSACYSEDLGKSSAEWYPGEEYNAITTGTFEHKHSSGAMRDSISLASEASDDDLHTASIISLTPIVNKGMMEGSVMPRVLDMREEVIMGMEAHTEVGLAL